MSKDEIQKAIEYAIIEELYRWREEGMKAKDTPQAFARCVCRRLLTSGQFISVKQWKEKLEAKRQELIDLIKSGSDVERAMQEIKREPYEIGYADAMRKARISELHLVERFLAQLPKSQEKIET